MRALAPMLLSRLCRCLAMSLRPVVEERIQDQNEPEIGAAIGNARAMLLHIGGDHIDVDVVEQRVGSDH